MTDSQATTDAADTASTEGAEQKQEQTFTQAEVDRIVKTRAERIAKERYPDYDELKSKAAGAQTVEQKLADLETRYKDAETKALRSDIAAKHGLSAEDRDLFLTGADEETLTAQATRLAERVAAVKKQGNVAPKEGDAKTSGKGDTAMREFARNLFDRAD